MNRRGVGHDPPKLGRLERVDLRTARKNEASDFTPGLASEDNIRLLGDTLGLDLEVQQQEAQVGPFRAHILCRNTADNSLVMVENQLERTDHGHLGQLFTDAAGLDAVTVVWIASRFTEEHRAAVDRLNRITHDGFHCFGLEIELWRIGDSEPAPRSTWWPGPTTEAMDRVLRPPIKALDAADWTPEGPGEP